MKGVLGLLLFITLWGSALASSSVPFMAVVTRVSDGDTVWVRAAAGQQVSTRPRKVRLLGIDAPEICQAGGRAARDALLHRVYQREVKVLPRATDGYGRLLAQLQFDGDDVGGWLVGQGHAWSSRYRRRAGLFDAQEAQARRLGRGLFAAADALPPWVFRRMHGPCPG